MSVQAMCPGCGAEIVFTTAAPLRVCDHCRSVVARRDRDLENLGKVVDLVASQSPLELWLKGAWRGASFTLVGHAQLAHPQGGVWDEWYAAFDDGRWGWLAEAQGKFYLTFESGEGASELPGFAALEPGRLVASMPGAGAFLVAEKSSAERRGAAGEIPYRFRPGERFAFADLSGEDGAFATLDYGDGSLLPTLYVGREVTLAELGWAERAPAERAAVSVKAERMACPECDGALELHAPDQTQRVGCPYCGTLSEVTPEGKLSKLRLLHGPRVKPVLPLGGKGTLRGVEWTVLAHLHKGTRVEGEWYYWDEYLLYKASEGFRWLVAANRHWSFAEPVPLAEVKDDPPGHVRWRDQRMKLFQGGMAHVKQVVGECYWKVELGEKTLTADYVAPPLMLSSERNASEVQWSLGTYMPAQEVGKAFGVPLEAPVDVAPNQPAPHPGVLRAWAIFAALAAVLTLVVFNTRGTRTVLEQRVMLGELEAPAGAPSVWFSEPFPLASGRNVEVQLDAPLSNTWTYVAGDFVNEATGLVQEFDASLEEYHGYEDGESWHEGDSDRQVYLSALPSGQYTLRLEIQAEQAGVPLYVHLRVRQGVPRWAHLLLLLLGLSIVPLFVLWRRHAFEKRRWEQSDAAAGSMASASDDDE